MLNETGMYYTNHDALKKKTASVRLNVATAPVIPDPPSTSLATLTQRTMLVR